MALMYSFTDLEPVCCSMCSSDCCFLTCIQNSQEAGQVVWYSHLFKDLPQFVVIYTVKGFSIVNKAEKPLLHRASAKCNTGSWSVKNFLIDFLKIIKSRAELISLQYKLTRVLRSCVFESTNMLSTDKTHEKLH